MVIVDVEDVPGGEWMETQVCDRLAAAFATSAPGRKFKPDEVRHKYLMLVITFREAIDGIPSMAFRTISRLALAFSESAEVDVLFVRFEEVAFNAEKRAVAVKPSEDARPPQGFVEAIAMTVCVRIARPVMN